MKTTDYLAFYAAILSTFVFLWNILQSRPRIKVDLIFGVEGTGDDIKSGVYVVVRNLSSYDVHLANISILYPYKAVGLKARLTHAWKYKRLPRRLGWVHSDLSNYSIASGCPVGIEARKSYRVLISSPSIEKMLADAVNRSLIACVQDQLWNNVYSKKFRCSAPRSA